MRTAKVLHFFDSEIVSKGGRFRGLVFGGFPEDWLFSDGHLRLGPTPGVGFEAKANAFEVLSALVS